MNTKGGLILLVVLSASALYLPGVSPEQYLEGEEIALKVAPLSSTKTQLPYDYYFLPFCKPEKIENAAQNLGEALGGAKLENSPYKILAKRQMVCEFLCTKEYKAEEMKLFEEKIHDGYTVHWLLDNLPAATKLTFPSEEDPNVVVTKYENGFPLGQVGGPHLPGSKLGVAYLNNHVSLKVLHYTDSSFKGIRIVGFEARPLSVLHSTSERTCHNPGVYQPADKAGSVTWTYSVVWELSKIRWASRWDNYLNMLETDIHWFSIINSLLIVLFLSGMIATILIRALRKDMDRYNSLDEDGMEETGWKLVHADVFRPPQNHMLFCVLVGSGIQLLFDTFVTLFFAALGFLSPATRGALMTAVLFLFTLMGVAAGYVSSRLYKLFNGKDWKQVTGLTAFLLPGVIFTMFFILNLFVWGTGSSGAVPFGTLLALMALWFFVSVPLVCAGAYVGFGQAVFALPVRINQIPKVVPPQPWHMTTFPSLVLGSMLPFGAVFIELFLIMGSLWLHQFYYVFGFLLLVLILLVITCAEISILLVYFQLCSEDYHWWWRSFLAPASMAFHVFLFSIYYFFTSLQITARISMLLYFGYSFLISLLVFCLAGSVGFLSAFFFNVYIYGAIKID